MTYVRREIARYTTRRGAARREVTSGGWVAMAKRWESRSAGEERERTVSHLCAFRWPTLATTAGCYAAIVRLVRRQTGSFSIITVAVVVAFSSSVLAISRRACQVSVRFSLGGSETMTTTSSARRPSFAGPCCRREREREAELS